MKVQIGLLVIVFIVIVFLYASDSVAKPDLMTDKDEGKNKNNAFGKNDLGRYAINFVRIAFKLILLFLALFVVLAVLALMNSDQM